MPNLTVYLIEGHAAERKTDLLRRMTDVVAGSLSAPKASVRIFLVELPKAHVCVGGVTLDGADAPDPSLGGPTIHAMLISGRTEAQKEQLIAGLTRVVQETLAIPADPVRIMIFDIANTDFGLQGVPAKSLGR